MRVCVSNPRGWPDFVTFYENFALQRVPCLPIRMEIRILGWLNNETFRSYQRYFFNRRVYLSSRTDQNFSRVEYLSTLVSFNVSEDWDCGLIGAINKLDFSIVSAILYYWKGIYFFWNELKSLARKTLVTIIRPNLRT